LLTVSHGETIMAKNQNAVDAETDKQAAPVRSSLDADPAGTGTSINGAAAQVEAAEQDAVALKSIETEMMAKFDAFVESGADPLLCRWVYRFTFRNVYADPEKNIKTLADYFRARYNIPTTDTGKGAGSVLKSKRNSWKYLYDKGAELLGVNTGGTGASKGASPLAARFSEYVKANFKVGPDGMTLLEAHGIVKQVTELYQTAEAAVAAELAKKAA